MKIGICCGIDKAAPAAAIGYQYLECGLSDISSLSNEQFEELLGINRQNTIRCEVTNGFCGSSIMLAGPGFDPQKLNEYCKKVIDRAARLGVSVIVVGSGKSRKVPDGYGREHGVTDLLKAFQLIGDEASQYGIMAVVEPLAPSETNLINMVGEGTGFIKTLNHPNVRVMADFYHMRASCEEMSSIFRAGSLLRHVHIANFNGERCFPSSPDEDCYSDLFFQLRTIGYDGRVSIEAIPKDFEQDARSAYRCLQTFL